MRKREKETKEKYILFTQNENEPLPVLRPVGALHCSAIRFLCRKRVEGERWMIVSPIIVTANGAANGAAAATDVRYQATCFS